MSLPTKYLKSTCYYDLMSNQGYWRARPIMDSLDQTSPMHVYASDPCQKGACIRCNDAAISLGMYNSCPICGLKLPSMIAPDGGRTEYECKCGAVLYICNGSRIRGPVGGNIKIVTAVILNDEDDVI